VQKIYFSFKYYWTAGTLREDQFSALITALNSSLEREMIQTETSDTLKIYFIYNINFFSENLALYETMWRTMMHSNNITRHMRSACRITKARIRTHRIGNTCSFFSSTILRRTRPNITLHVRCVSCHTLTTHDSTPFMSHQKCNIDYGCCQIDSIFPWPPKLNTHRIGDGFVIESYKFSRKVCQLYFFGLFNFKDGNVPIKNNYQNEIPVIIPDQAVRKIHNFCWKWNVLKPTILP